MMCELEVFLSAQQYKKLYEKKYKPLMERYGLRKIELDILLFLSRYGQYDTAKDIALRRCFSKAHVSKAVEKLLDKNYLSAIPGCGDRRCVHLKLTGAARGLLEETREIEEKLLAAVYGGVPKHEKEVFLMVSKRIAENISRELEQP